MDEMGKDFITFMATVLGHVMLWGSLFIGFMYWTYSMGFFRVSLMGLFLIGVGQYFKSEWSIK